MLVLFLLAGRTATADETAAPSCRPSRTANSLFEKADASKDDRLTLEEYVAIDRNKPELLQRDFRLFDLDGNGALSLDEFRTISPRPGDGTPRCSRPGRRHPRPGGRRGSDETWGGWDKQPNRARPVGAVRRPASSSRSTPKGVQATQTEIQLADPDRDGQTTREEARRFLEIHLGMRALTEELLRRPPNRVVNFSPSFSVSMPTRTTACRRGVPRDELP